MICPNCSTEFQPRDPRQKCCSKKCGAKRYEKTPSRKAQSKQAYWRNHSKIRERLNQRYQSDQEYADKIRNQMRKFRALYPEKHRAANARWRSDPHNQEIAKAHARQWHEEHREFANMKRKQHVQNERVQMPWKKLVDAAISRSRKKKLPFDLTVEWAKERWTGRCELTGIPFQIGLRGVGAKYFSPSIDKIDPALGYTKENCRFVLWCINAFKYDSTDENMYLVAAELLKHRGVMLVTPVNDEIHGIRVVPTIHQIEAE